MLLSYDLAQIQRERKRERAKKTLQSIIKVGVFSCITIVIDTIKSLDVFLILTYRRNFRDYFLIFFASSLFVEVYPHKTQPYGPQSNSNIATVSDTLYYRGRGKLSSNININMNKHDPI